MNKVLHKLFSITMALLLLLSTTSWTVGKHFCMGNLVDVSLFADAEDCGMVMAMSEDPDRQLQADDSCCKDETVTVEGQDNLKLSFNDLNLEQHLFFVAFTHSYFGSLQIATKRPIPNEYYPPPLLVKNIQLLDEVFLI